ncbi:uncharacterized protein LOC142553638 [Primulina tabacum]|uniref:uncharacterized protein LOC142553638 n=1 Tax=Primulina tabacum TaxID=48773 RepID=UPI003F5A9F03
MAKRKKTKAKRKKTKAEKYCQEGTDSGMKMIRPPYMPSDNRNSDIVFGEREIPQWEKDFCLEVGLFTWKHFLEAKQHTKNHHKVLRWDDSAAEEAFSVAKCRYLARINDLPYADIRLLMDPNMFIDEIKWDDDLHTQLSRQKAIWAKLEKEDEEKDYLLYSQLIELVRSCQASEI